MTSINIEPNDRRIEYTGNVNTVYVYDFPIANKEDITVNKNGVDLVLTTDYTVQDVGVETGGTITLVVATAVEDDLVLFGSAIVERVDQNFQQAGDFFSITLNGQLNAQVVFIQELSTRVDRKWGLSDSSTYSGSLDFPEAVAGQLLGWNASANALENKDVSSGGQLPSVADTYIRANGSGLYVAKTPLEVATELFLLKNTNNLAEGSSNLYDKTVVLNAGTGIGVSGTYPSFTITNTSVFVQKLEEWETTGSVPQWVDATTLSIPAGKVRNYENSADITVQANASVTTSMSANTPYFVNVNSSGVTTIETSIATGTSRTLWAYKTNASSQIREFINTDLGGSGIMTIYANYVTDVSGTTTAKTLRNMSVPSGADVELLGVAFLYTDVASPRDMFIYDGNDSKMWIGVINSNARNSDSSLTGVRTSTGTISTEVSGSIKSILVRLNGYIYGRKQ